MSYVTSVVIVTGFASPDFERAVTAPFMFRGDGEFEDSFRRIDTNGAGGTKVMGHDIFAAGLNYCDRDRLRAWCDALPWLDWNWGVVAVDTEGDFPEVWTYGIDAQSHPAIRP